MNTIDVVKVLGITSVLGVQMVAPLWIAWREMRAPKVDPTASKARKSTPEEQQKSAAALPTLAPLRCPSCKAPVPLLARRYPCPHCAAEVAPPPDYVQALAARMKSDALVARSERMWRRSRIVCARPTTWAMGVLLVAWTVLVIWVSFAAFDYGVPGPVLALPIIVAVVQCFLGFFLISVIGDSRKSLPPLPARAAMRVPAVEAACVGCGGLCTFDKDRLASTCRYCGAENFRAALAHSASAHEAAGERVMNASLLQQIKEHDARRHEVLGFFVIIGVAELFYGALLPIGWVAEQLGL